MNTDKEVERIVHDWLEDRVADPQLGGLGEALKKVESTTQVRRRFLGRWSRDRQGARTRDTRHEAPTASRRTNKRITFTATGLVAALVVLAFTANLAVSPDANDAPAASIGYRFVVAADGSGEYSRIAEAVAAAADGDTVAVKPGIYTETIVIDKDIMLIGDGPRAEIVLEAPEGGPTYDPRYDFMEEASYAVLIQGSAATLSGLTFRGERARVFVDGGAPVLEDLAFDSVSTPVTGLDRSFAGPANAGAVIVNGGAVATIRDSTFTEGGNLDVFEGSDTLIEHNTFSGGPGIAGDFGSGSVIRDNQISGSFDSAIILAQPTTMLIEGNTIHAAGRNAIDVGWNGPSPGVDPIIRGNTMVDSVGTAINLAAETNATIEDNVITGNRLGISVFRTGPVIARNEFTGNATGIMVTVGAPTVEDNTISGGKVGLMLAGAGTSPTLSGNTICGNETNLQLATGAPAPETNGNDICD